MWEACGGQRTTYWSQFPFYHMFYRDLVHQLSCKHPYLLSHPADPKKKENLMVECCHFQNCLPL